VVWASGYVLTQVRGIALTELWVLGAWLSSFISQLAVIHSVEKNVRTPRALVIAVVPLLLALGLMVVRPTFWSWTS
jgi:hypothetical protein